jgi:hypothetical protein
LRGLDQNGVVKTYQICRGGRYFADAVGLGWGELSLGFLCGHAALNESAEPVANGAPILGGKIADFSQRFFAHADGGGGLAGRSFACPTFA